MKRAIGLQIRYRHSPLEILKKAAQLQIRTTQCFLLSEKEFPATLSKSEQIIFKRQKAASLDTLYAHASYRINLACPIRHYHPILVKELHIAQMLGCSSIILHPGSASTVTEGINALARIINRLHVKYPEIRLVLENVAFKAPSIGGNLIHFKELLTKLNWPENMFFCIDTAHAYAAGYDLVHEKDRFIDLLERTIGLEQIMLIHLNDTPTPLESYTDIHCSLGHGNIGQEALRRFALDPRIMHIPIILELPIMKQNEEKQILTLVESWHKGD